MTTTASTYNAKNGHSMFGHHDTADRLKTRAMRLDAMARQARRFFEESASRFTLEDLRDDRRLVQFLVERQLEGLEDGNLL